jgi:hypothetical protein
MAAAGVEQHQQDIGRACDASYASQQQAGQGVGWDQQRGVAHLLSEELCVHLAAVE